MRFQRKVKEMRECPDIFWALSLNSRSSLSLGELTSDPNITQLHFLLIFHPFLMAWYHSLCGHCIHPISLGTTHNLRMRAMELCQIEEQKGPAMQIDVYPIRHTSKVLIFMDFCYRDNFL